MLHTFSSTLIQFSEGFGIQWYGFSYLLGFILSFVLLFWLTQKQRTNLNADSLFDFVFICLLGALIGGRIGYCLFYAPDLFLKFKNEAPYWGVFAIGEGGMSSFGAILGVIVSSVIFAYRKNMNTLYLLDLASLCAPIGIFLGRISNFMGGDLLGRPSEILWPLSMKFPQEIFMWAKSEPDKLQGLSAVVEKVGVTSNQWSDWMLNYRVDGTALQALHSTLEKLVERVQEGHSEIIQMLEPQLTYRHPVQIYGAATEGVLLFLILFMFWKKPRTPGALSGLFIIFYSVFRIVNEFFRLPDPQLGYEIFDLTRGQILSLLFLIIGMGTLYFWSQTGSLAIQGWGKGQHVRFNRR